MAESLESAAAPATENGLRAELVKHWAYGEAAIMLIESLMLTLIKHRAVTALQMVGAVEDALATKLQMVADGDHAEVSAVAAGLLKTMANSLAANEGTARN
jgi:hypothetical protein